MPKRTSPIIRDAHQMVAYGPPRDAGDACEDRQMAVPGPSGRVVVLNGSSSAGKSSLAVALQARWMAEGECWVIFSWDDFIPRLPDRWRGVPGAAGDLADAGSTYL